MKLKSILYILAITVITVACGAKKDGNPNDGAGHTNDELKLTGDKTVYGLACEGSTDSVIVLLPNDGSDPVKYNIIEAFKKRRIIGQIKTGDWVGLVLSTKHKGVADMAINLDQLKGTWAYKVMPVIKAYTNGDDQLISNVDGNIPDTIKEKLMVPREYGISIKRHWGASALSNMHRDNVTNPDNIVEYPARVYYTAWHILNGKFVLTHGTMQIDKNTNAISYTNLQNDTTEVLFLTQDSLRLKFKDQIIGFYRKTNGTAMTGKTGK